MERAWEEGVSMYIQTLAAILLQAEDGTMPLLSDQILGVIVAGMFLIGVGWMVKRILTHKPVDHKMSIRLDDASSEQGDRLFGGR